MSSLSYSNSTTLTCYSSDTCYKVTGYWTTAGIPVPAEMKIFFTTFKVTLEPTRSPIQWELRPRDKGDQIVKPTSHLHIRLQWLLNVSKCGEASGAMNGKPSSQWADSCSSSERHLSQQTIKHCPNDNETSQRAFLAVCCSAVRRGIMWTALTRLYPTCGH